MDKDKDKKKNKGVKLDAAPESKAASRKLSKTKEMNRKKSLHGVALLRQQKAQQHKSESAPSAGTGPGDEEEEDEDEETGPERIPLILRSDSELTPAEIIEKDIIMYDKLIAEEELMEAGGMEEEEEEPEVVEEVEEEEEGEEEEDEEEEEAEEDEDEAEEETTEKAEKIDPNDPDNIINMMMQDQEVEEDDLKLIFMDTSALEQETDTVASYSGVVGLDLSPETLTFFEIETLADKEPGYAYISFKRVKLHVFIFGESSEFAPFQNLFKHYPDFTMLLGADFLKSTGHSYYLCTTIEARNLVLNPPKKKRKVYVDLKKKEEEAWAKMASIEPRKWRSLGSELEVDEENVVNSRPLLTVFAYRYHENFNRPVEFSDWDTEKNPNVLVGFDSKDPMLFPAVESMEVDAAVQVMPQKTTSSSQTGFSFKRNKMLQYENQFLDPESVQALLDIPADVIGKKTKFLQRALLQNEMMSLTLDDYKKLRAVKGHDVEYNNESILLQEYQTYCDLRHSKNRCVTNLVFHPTLEDVVVSSICEDATFDARIDLHSKTLMEPNFVLFWDLKDPIHPQLMLDAPSDVFSFHINPSDPQFMCGGCANGQIVLWDLGRLYTDLKARIQDRRRKNKDVGGKKKKAGFLDKLEDKAEKYVCPLVPTVALSNLDQSHKKVVTCVCWLPPHVELGKNGTLYENSMGGKSVQFFSTAADGSIRLWDIRAPKAGLEEYEVDTSKDIIKVNPWVHLQNNMWKFASKYILDDGSGTMFATLISPSEPKLGESLANETLALHRASMAAVATSAGELSASSPHGSKELVQKSSGEIQSKSNEIQSKSIELQSKSKRSGLNVPAGAGAVLPVGGEGPDGATGVDAEAVLARRAAGMLNVLSTALTSIFIGTETGQVVLVDWLRNKDGTINPDSTGTRVCQNMYLDTAHDGAITCIARSPFYNNLILVVGGGTISIWKENSGHPLLATGGSEYFPWCGCWSNTRPAVFFVGTREGALQVWDLTEKSKGPVLIQQVSPGRLTACAIPKAGLAKKQFLALGDSLGNVFAMLLPRFYYKPTPHENAMMQELMSREEKRLINWTNEAESREEKIEAIHSAWKESRKSSTEGEQKSKELQLEERLVGEYADFLEFELKLVGRLKRDEPVLAFEESNVSDEFETLVHAAREREAEQRERGELQESNSSISIGSDNDFY